MNSQKEQSQNLPLDGITDFNKDDIASIDSYIKNTSIRISYLGVQKDKAMSLNRYYGIVKEIRKESQNIMYGLICYKELEKKLDLPVNLEYRSALKKLTKKK